MYISSLVYHNLLLLTLGIHSLRSYLSMETKMHIDLRVVELFLIYFGYVCLGEPHLPAP